MSKAKLLLMDYKGAYGFNSVAMEIILHLYFALQRVENNMRIHLLGSSLKYSTHEAFPLY